MIIELEINGARVIVTGENLAISVSETSGKAAAAPVIKTTDARGMRHIRKHIFRLNQIEFAELVGVHQSSVSRWENGVVPPSRGEMIVIRLAAAARGLQLDDSLFFEVAK